MKRGQQSRAAHRGLGATHPAFGGNFGGFGGFGGIGSGTSLSYLSEPPSFSNVSDPNVVVSLKNVLKKDSNTKTKALDDILSYVQVHPFEKDGGVEDAVLDVWDKLYPLLSIDNSRRVRELSHVLQFELMKSARKRMEKHIPNVVGAWLAGTFDRDRGVAKVANDGISSFLTTPEKALGFWKKCQPQILAFATEAIQETKTTLSDERSTTEEDAEAKYLRVINASLCLVHNLLQRIPNDDLESAQPDYDEYFKNETIWKAITFEEPSVRRNVCQLLVLCLSRKLHYADSIKCHQAILTGGLRTVQRGSALEYVSALSKLTESHPEIWYGTVGTKKPPVARLQAFVARGSQGSRAFYWEALDQLLSQLPQDTQDMQFTSELLVSIKSGIANREEPRAHNTAAWKCYTQASRRAFGNLEASAKLTIAKEYIFQLFEDHLFPSKSQSVAGAGPPTPSSLRDMYLLIAQQPSLNDATMEELTRLGNMMCTKISASLPGVSKEYQVSQERVAEEGHRWFELVKELQKACNYQEGKLSDFTLQPSTEIVSLCLNLLESRNMKPFGAARILESALKATPYVFGGELETKLSNFLAEAAKDNFKRTVETPSLVPLLSCVNLLKTIAGVEQRALDVWSTWTTAGLRLDNSPERTGVLASLVSHDKVSRYVQQNTELQATIESEALSIAKSESSDWRLFNAAMVHNGLTVEKSRDLLQQLVDVVDKEPSERSLEVLESLSRTMPDLVAQDDQVHTALVTKLLSLSELSDRETVSAKATSIRALLDHKVDGKPPVIRIIQSNLETANPQSLGIEILIKQAKAAISDNSPPEDILPNTNIWMEELLPFLELQINPSLSITNDIGSVVTLASTPLRGTQKSTLRVQRDGKGRSVPARMALYAVSLLEEGLESLQLPTEFLTELLYLQCITAELVLDQTSLQETHGLWLSVDQPELDTETEDLVLKLRQLISLYTKSSKWWLNESNDRLPTAMRGLMDLLVRETKTLSPRGVYSARSLTNILCYIAEVQGLPSSLEPTFVTEDTLKLTAETVLHASALLVGFSECLQSSKQINTFCNRVVSDITGASVDGSRTRMALSVIALFSRVYEQGQLPVANNRIVFAVRQITSWLDEPDDLDAMLCTEICQALITLLPCMKDVYGSYWERSVEFCLHIWDSAREYPLSQALPLIYSSLRLAKVLESMTEANDDLLDALKDLQSAKPKALLELLKLPHDASSLVAKIVDANLSRAVAQIPVKNIPPLEEIFPLVASDSRIVQTAAYGLLHRAIPAQQEQKSIDVLLDKTDARLPDELLSLLLDAPTLESYPDEILSEFPVAVRCYLLSWKLVFDAFSTSSLKVRNDFVENLKAENAIAPLLEFTFDVLGHSAANPLNLEREGLAGDTRWIYDLSIAEKQEEEKNMHWLLVHLYYLTLKYVPGLFKAWYIDCRSKQTRLAVESWTTKYFSPQIILETLLEVDDWWSKQEPAGPDETEMQVSISKSSREVIAGFQVDESLATVVIKIPASYPIDNITVNSSNRVAVSEKTWQSWIMTTQGVITFSNGSIIDGLQVFRRNVVGALKGQSECAICYSIISSDKRMPDKRCATCKNQFHRTCLYKWFQSSNQNTCPLCRNPIDYLGADTAKRRQA